MKYKAYYHILMINHWEQIVREQLSLIVRSGLYDKLDSIQIGALGEPIETLQEMIKPYKKIDIVRYSTNVNRYEFWTLQIAWHDAVNEKPFYGLYFHTKGVSFPNHSGGDYWRHYMNHYNLKEWKECEKKLRKGFDTCGVKFLDKTCRPVYKPHYSGNFFWFKSSYMARLRSPEESNLSDRFEAEFWIGTGDPNAATLCQDFVDYNTKGTFYKGKNYVHTLAYNLVSETEKAVSLLYDLNDNFEHYIVDLGFPLLSDRIPKNIEYAKQKNGEKLKELAQKYGSEYVQIPNVGVSQNWTAIYKYLDLNDSDILIGADPDEHPQDEGWVQAMGDVSRKGVDLVSLMMTDHEPLMRGKIVTKVEGYNVMLSPGNFNWALIGMSGRLLNAMGEVPVPGGAEVYGWIESMVRGELARLKMEWAVLPDYRVRHTDYSLGDPGTSRLLREWKNTIIHKIKKYGQVTFDEFLQDYEKFK